MGKENFSVLPIEICPSCQRLLDLSTRYPQCVILDMAKKDSLKKGLEVHPSDLILVTEYNWTKFILPRTSYLVFKIF